MKTLQEYLNESITEALKAPTFNEESKIRTLGGREKETVFTIDGMSILGYAQGDEKAMMELVTKAGRKEKIYALHYNRVFGAWETVITSYYTNAYGKTDDEIMGSSSDGTGITKNKIEYWAENNDVLVKIS